MLSLWNIKPFASQYSVAAERIAFDLRYFWLRVSSWRRKSVSCSQAKHLCSTRVFSAKTREKLAVLEHSLYIPARRYISTMTNIPLKDWTSEHYIANESTCKLALEDSNCLRQIPSLNSAALDDLRDGQLVKFRGMIQDMYDPEYYFNRYEVKNSETGEYEIRNGMYMDSARCSIEGNEIIELDSERNKISERHTCFVISIPGLNDWDKEKDIRCNRDLKCTENAPLKREHAESEVEPMDCSEPVRKKEKIEKPAETGRPVLNSVEKKSNLSREHIMNFPIPIDDGRACIVKVYDDKVEYKLNEVVDIVGFISLDPTLSRIQSSDDTMDDAEIQTHNPPASLVPRLHAIKIVEQSSNRTNPNAAAIFSKAENIRSDLHMVLSQLLFGDELAADYLICHLISAVYTRKDQLCLGSFPINITNFPIDKYETFPKDLYEVVTKLVPKSYYLECTLENLNDMSMVPKKDYECNRLTSGLLQLSKNTHLVIDETGLVSGQVSASGRKNYEAMSDLIKFQSVTYDFKYFTMEYEADIPVLILSEVKSFIPCVTQVPLKIDRETEELYPRVLEAAKQYLRDEERLSNIRDYLRLLRDTEFQFGQDITNVIQEDFVKLRQADKNFGADNLHSLMVFARLTSLSRGNNFLSVECWKETVQKELERAQRLPQHNK